jgi:dihydroorotate dehydrogenase (fumarate)
MMDLKTDYLGLTLDSPFMPGASPLADDLDVVSRLEDAGASAIVMRSLFAEQLDRARTGDPSAFLPANDEYALSPDRYLEQVLRIKRRIHVPLIASLNGTSAESWLKHGRLIEQAGADAIELNFYHVVTDLTEDGRSVEHRVVDIAAVLKESIRIPLAVKLTPFYSALPSLAWQLSRLGVNGLVLFNRFFQSDFNPEGTGGNSRLALSDSSDLLIRLHWLALLSGRIRGSFAVSGGVHEPLDAVKAVMAGADVVQMVSALLQRGPQYLAHIRREFEKWGDAHGYASIGEMRGRLSLARYPNASLRERGDYIRLLQAWHPDRAATTPAP